MNWNEIFSDPDFQALPQAEKHKALQDMDPDFAGLPPEEMDKAIAELSAPQKTSSANPFLQAIQQGASAGLNIANAAPIQSAESVGAVARNTLLPLAPQGGNPLMMALDAAKQTIQNPMRAAQSLRQPSQVAGEAVANKIGGLPGQAAGFVTEMVTDPAVLLSGGMAGAKALRLLTSGKRIGQAEKAAGIITKAADKYPTSGNVGETLNTLEGQLDNGTMTDPQTLRVAKDIIDYIWKNDKLVGKSTAITVQSARVYDKLAKALNAAVPGRAEAAKDFATLQTAMKPVKLVGKAALGLTGGAATLAAIRSFLQGH